MKQKPMKQNPDRTLTYISYLATAITSGGPTQDVG